MKKNEYIKKMRLFLADPDGRIWNDNEISILLEQSLKQYCIDSGAFTGRFDFCPDMNGIYHYPDDFGCFVIGWNEDNKEIIPATAFELFSSKNKNINFSGKVGYIYDDQSNYGDFEIYPLPPNKQNIQEMNIEPVYGEIIDSSCGVYMHGDAYGVTVSGAFFDFAGEIYYRKIGNFEDVKDYMAVIYYALSLAYNTDAELANPENAAFWKTQYQNRINAFGKIFYQNTGIKTSLNFY
jgi:hypothetical protein